MGWRDFISDKNDDELIHIRTFAPFQLEAKIAILMDEAVNYESCLKIGAIIDCFFNMYMFANESKLDDDKLLFLLKLQGKLIENCEDNISVQENLKQFKDTLRDDESADGTMIFGDLKTSKDVIDYMLQSFFQHYQLYHHLFHCTQKEEELYQEVSLDVIPLTPTYPPPLEESICEELYNLYLNPQEEVEESVTEKNGDVPSSESVVAVDEKQSVPDPENQVESLLASIKEDDMRRLIRETAEKKLSSVKTELESKILEKETMLLKNLDKNSDRLKIM